MSDTVKKAKASYGLLKEKIAAVLEILNGKVDTLKGVTDCDHIYAKRADGTQGYQELWTEVVPNSIPSRDDSAVLYSESNDNEKALVNNGWLASILTGFAKLVGGKIPASLLPSFVDDVLEFASLADFPATGESGKIYIALDKNKTYRWGGSTYVVISQSIALGETSSTAHRGDHGKAAYEHSQATGNPHGTGKGDIGLGNVDNTKDIDKPISTATQAAIDAKVSKVEGKGLSANDFTNELKSKLDGVEEGAQRNELQAVTSVAGKDGVVVLNKTDVGLGNVDNTKDIDKPISTDTQAALNGKTNKINTPSILYGTDGSGGQTTYSFNELNNAVKSSAGKDYDDGLHVETIVTNDGMVLDSSTTVKYGDQNYAEWALIRGGYVLNPFAGKFAQVVLQTGTQLEGYSDAIIDLKSAANQSSITISSLNGKVIIKNVTNPEENHWAVNKLYVDKTIETKVDKTHTSEIAEGVFQTNAISSTDKDIGFSLSGTRCGDIKLDLHQDFAYGYGYTKRLALEFTEPDDIEDPNPDRHSVTAGIVIARSPENPASITVGAKGGVSIHDIVSPEEGTDAVNKDYVDNAINEAGVCEEITYEDLVVKVNDSSLTSGKKYLITDYKTVYIQPVTDIVMEGVTEPIAVTAISNSKLAPVAFSPSRPKDIIYYDIENDANKYTWADASGKGIIYRRIDEFGNDLPYDFKNIKFRRWAVDNTIPAYSPSADYSIGDIIIYNGLVFICVKEITGGMAGTPGSNPHSTTSLYWQSLLKDAINNKTYYSWSPTGIPFEVKLTDRTIPVLADDFKDCYTFHLYMDNSDYTQGSYGRTVGNSIKACYDSSNRQFLNNAVFMAYYPSQPIWCNTIGYNFYNNTLKEYCSYNSIGNNCYNNIIGANFQNNTVPDGFFKNIVGANFYYNRVGNYFHSNIIADQFSYNSVGNDFTRNFCGYQCANNTIGDKASGNHFNWNFYGNLLETEVTHNVIGSQCQSNSFGGLVGGCTIGNNFKTNVIEKEIRLKDFTAADELYGKSYGHQILKGAGGIVITWYDANGDLQKTIINN
jgi:hypothetical protein